MKNLKLTKGIQIILITILMIVLGIIIAGIYSNNRTLAATPR